MADDEGPRYFSQDARSRIKRTVRSYEQGEMGTPTQDGTSRSPQRTFWLAKADNTYPPDTVGTFTLQKPNGDKGDEVDSDQIVDAYVRKGVCIESRLYRLMELCIADDAALEVMDPTLQGTGTCAEDIAADADGDVTVAGETIEMNATFGSVTDLAVIWWAWDDNEERFSIIQAACS